MHIHLLTCSELPDLYPDDVILRDCLIGRGHKVTWGVWGEGFDCSPDTVAVIRSCWDYYKRPGQFYDYIRNLPVQVLNTPEAVRWNTDKVYLEYFQKQLVNIVPTSFDWQPPTDDEWLIVKPRVSNAGKNIQKVRRDDLGIPQPGMMIQPFLEGVQGIGEFSVIFIGGQYSHCVHKRPGEGDFRVQHFYGGTYERVEPDNSLMWWAGHCMLNMPFETLYARLDFIPSRGQWLLSEAELIEPLLHFDLCPGAADLMVSHIEAVERQN